MQKIFRTIIVILACLLMSAQTALFAQSAAAKRQNANVCCEL